jgi:RsiW-degrading membrane proteinase PrsW (M82 family)
MSLTVLYALLGGVVPAVVWAWFWNHEDSAHPEPFRLLGAAFAVGMLTVLVVIPFQKLAMAFFSGTLMFTVWAAIEECAKYGLAWATVLSTKNNDEPLDPLIYMITIALGFAAAENTLFLIHPIAQSGVIEGILTGNFRFLGATLLHVLSSSVIGAAMALSFYKNKRTRRRAALVGLVLAIAVHSAFNFFILSGGNDGILRVFAFVWIGLVALLLVFEKIKRIRN